MENPEFEFGVPLTDQVATPRPAATVMLLRGDAQTLELLMVQRTHAARFMGGAWVFPGGAVELSDGEPETTAAHMAAARRELGEETGIKVPADYELIPYARWITPVGPSIRFDTWFFLARAPDDAVPVIDGSEIVDHRWLTPQAALAAPEVALAFPTRKQLEQVSAFGSATELIEHARGREVLPIEPRVIRAEQARIVLPGDPGYDQAGPQA
jgi:8-oxo-dGTP pyrophosphatase MutT (NUDIX family)